MTVKKDYKKYQELVALAIGNRTKGDFANAAGLSRRLISESLNDGPASRPSKSTLKKIALASEGRVSFQDLLTSCGYEAEEIEASKELQDRQALSIMERTSRCANELKEGFLRLGDKRQIYDNFEDYIEMVNMLYAVEQVTYTVSEEKDFGDTKHPTADGTVIITASWAGTDFTADFEVLVWFAHLVKGGVVILDTEFSKDALETGGSKLIANAEEAKKDEGYHTTQVFSDKVVYQVRTKRKEQEENKIIARSFDRKVKAFMKNKGMSEKDAVMAAIFGDPDRPKRIMSVEGIGFYLDEVPEYCVKNFILKHADTFNRSEDEAEILDGIQGDADMKDLFKYYTCDIDKPERGTWMVAINNIIYRETGISVSLWGTFDNYEEKRALQNRPVLMLDAAMPWDFKGKEKDMTGDECKNILDGYARELKTYAHDVYYLMQVDVEDSDIF